MDLSFRRITGQTSVMCGDAITAKSKVTVRSGRRLSTGERRRRSALESLEPG